MTVTDQATATDAPCMCGCAKWDHRQGRATCKHCGCDRYDPATFPEIDRLKAQVAQLEQAVTVLTAERDAAVKDANQAHNTNAKLRRRVEHLEREAVHAAVQVDEAREQRNRAQAQAADLEAALLEAHKGQRLSNAEHLHQRLSAAALVIGKLADRRFCPKCQEITEPTGARHACGPMLPADVMVIRRPKHPNTEEKS